MTYLGTTSLVSAPQASRMQDPASPHSAEEVAILRAELQDKSKAQAGQIDALHKQMAELKMTGRAGTQWSRLLPPPVLGHNQQTALHAITFFRDDASSLAEWLLHHRNEGVSTFWLVDDDSQDRPREALQELGWDVANESATGVFYIRLSRRVDQLAGYRIALGRLTQHAYVREDDFVTAIDLDEFMYSRSTHSLPSLLRGLDPLSPCVLVRYTAFLPSGYITDPPSSIAAHLLSDRLSSAECFPLKGAGAANLLGGKSVCRISQLRHRHVWTRSFEVHTPLTSNMGRLKISRSATSAVGWAQTLVYANYSCMRPTDHKIRLNHYRYRSVEYHYGIKVPRGSSFPKMVHGDPAHYKDQVNISSLFPEHALFTVDDFLARKLETTPGLQAAIQAHARRPNTSIYPNSPWELHLKHFKLAARSTHSVADSIEQQQEIQRILRTERRRSGSAIK